MTIRLSPKERHTMILHAACRVAYDKGLVAVNHGNVAKRCSTPTSVSTVRFYFRSQSELRRAVYNADPSDFHDQATELGLTNDV